MSDRKDLEVSERRYSGNDDLSIQLRRAFRGGAEYGRREPPSDDAALVLPDGTSMTVGEAKALIEQTLRAAPQEGRADG